MITNNTTRKPYSFEASLEQHFSDFSNNQLVDKFYSIKEEISSSYDELLKYKLSQMLKMIKRELIKRNLEI